MFEKKERESLMHYQPNHQKLIFFKIQELNRIRIKTVEIKHIISLFS